MHGNMAAGFIGRDECRGKDRELIGRALTRSTGL